MKQINNKIYDAVSVISFDPELRRLYNSAGSLVLDYSSGAVGPAIDITRTALQALISGNTVIKGQLYAITDFQDRTVADTNTRVIVRGTGISSISQSAIWHRLSQNKPFSSYILATGTSGSISQVTVGATTLMTGTVNYLTSRFVTLTNVAANINANSGVSGYRAIVIQGDSVIDTPAMIIEQVLPGTNTSSVSVTITTMTTTQVSVMGMGTAQAQQALDINYDITLDRITYCYDQQYGNEMTYNVQTLTTLGFNPITEFRWGHPNFRNWKISNTDFTNVFISPPTSGAQTVEQNNTLINGTFKNLIFRRTNNLFVSQSNNTGTFNISNVQAATTIRFNDNMINFAMVGVTAPAVIITGNRGTGAINFGTASFATLLTVTSNVCNGTIQATGAAYTIPSLTLTSNFIVSGNLGFSGTSTFTLGITVNNCTITNGCILPSGTRSHSINFQSSSFNQFTAQIFDISVGGKAFTINTSTFAAGCNITGTRVDTVVFSRVTMDAATTINCTTGSGATSFTDCIIQKGTYHFGNASAVTATNSFIGIGSQITMSTTGGGTFTLSNSTLKNATLTAGSKVLNFANSTIENSTILSTNLVLVDAVIQNSTLTNTNNVGSGLATMTDCYIMNTALDILDNSTNQNIFTNCTFKNSTIAYGSVIGISSFLNSTVDNSTVEINCGLATVFNPKIDGLNMTNSTLGEPSMGTVDYVDIKNLSMTSAVLTLIDIFVSKYSSVINHIDVVFAEPVNTFNFTRIDNGKLSIIFTTIFTDVPLVPGSPQLITDLPIGFSHDKTTFSVGSGITGGVGATLKLGYGASKDQFIPPTTITALNAQMTQRIVSFDQQMVTNTSMYLEATVATFTGATFSFVTEGVMINQNVNY